MKNEMEMGGKLGEFPTVFADIIASFYPEMSRNPMRIAIKKFGTFLNQIQRI